MVMGTTQRGAALPSLLALELRLYFSTLKRDDSNHTIGQPQVELQKPSKPQYDLDGNVCLKY